MTLLELRNYYWWSIDDNPSNPLLMSQAVLDQLINDALEDLAGDLEIPAEVTRRSTDAPDTIDYTTGIATLPVDFYSIVGVYWNGEHLPAVMTKEDIFKDTDDEDDDDSDTAAPDRYWLRSRRELQLLPKPTEAATDALVITYYRYPTALSATTDAPTDIPLEHHRDLLVYVQKEHAKKNGWFNMYQALETQWQDIKREIAGKVDDLKWPFDDPDQGRFVW